MKRAGGLWPRVIAFENLHRAARRALRGKRSKAYACAFHKDLEANLLALRRELAGGTYQPGAYSTFYIHEPKVRLISAAPFRDRVVHHALVQVLEPIFERRFIHHSYACRAGKGTHAAIAQFRSWARATGTVLKLDLRKFFPSIDHALLVERLGAAVKDPDVLALAALIIARSNPQEPVVRYYPGDDLFTPLERRRGLPIGNLTSQFFANVFLDPLDHYVTDRLGVRRYLRYVDDLVVCHPDKGFLTELRAAIAGRLEASRLSLNEGKSRVRRLSEGVEFLGFLHLPDRTRLGRTAVRRMRARGRRLAEGYRGWLLDWADVRASLQSWNAHAAHGDTYRLRTAVLRGGFQRGSGRPF